MVFLNFVQSVNNNYLEITEHGTKYWALSPCEHKMWALKYYKKKISGPW